MARARTVIIVQARMTSTRLPGKVLAALGPSTLLEQVVERCAAVRGVDDVVVACTEGPLDDPVAALAGARGWPVFRGSEDDVLDRYHRAAAAAGADHVGRVTSDCPFLDEEQASLVLDHHLDHGNDYTHNIVAFGSRMPLGAGMEFFTSAALDLSWRRGTQPHHREHVDEWVGEHREELRFETVHAPPELAHPDFRLTVDTPADLALMRHLHDELGPVHPGRIPLRAVVEHLVAHPDVARRNLSPATAPGPGG